MLMKRKFTFDFLAKKNAKTGGKLLKN